MVTLAWWASPIPSSDVPWAVSHAGLLSTFFLAVARTLEACISVIFIQCPPIPKGQGEREKTLVTYKLIYLTFCKLGWHTWWYSVWVELEQGDKWLNEATEFSGWALALGHIVWVWILEEPLLLLWPYVSDLVSPSLSFLTCEIGIIKWEIAGNTTQFQVQSKCQHVLMVV